MIEKLWSKAFGFNRLHARGDNATIIIKSLCSLCLATKNRLFHFDPQRSPE